MCTDIVRHLQPAATWWRRREAEDSIDEGGAERPSIDNKKRPRW